MVLRSSAPACVLASLVLAACGEDKPISRPVPSPEVVRNMYGLGDGSCWRYRFAQGGTSLYATVSVSGPNTTAIAGKTVFVRKLQLESGGLPLEDYFDTSADGEVRLLRHVEGQQGDRVTKRYEDDPEPPLFAKFIVVDADTARLTLGESWETTPTPKELPIERHVWSVLSETDPVDTPSGEQPSYKLNYNRSAGGGAMATSTFNVVPGFGVARFVDFDGTMYQVCDARVCDAAGTCTGAASCDALACN